MSGPLWPAGSHRLASRCRTTALRSAGAAKRHPDDRANPRSRLRQVRHNGRTDARTAVQVGGLPQEEVGDAEAIVVLVKMTFAARFRVSIRASVQTRMAVG